MKRGGCVYIITNNHHNVLYTGVTSNLKGRIWDHRSKQYPASFTAKYNCRKLVYYEFYSTIREAIAFEKSIKASNRNYKERLISTMNPTWRDLWEDVEKW